MTSLAVVHNKKSGNNHIVGLLLADILGGDLLCAEDNPVLDHETVIFVIPNAGDEEIAQPMEDFICSLPPTSSRQYCVCELGNYFGLENYCGCKKAAIRLLDNIGWKRISDVSIDSLPELDDEALKSWISELYRLEPFALPSPQK
jgi:flavodoxin